MRAAIGVLVALTLVLGEASQTRYGASVFVQTAEPAANVVDQGTFWFDTTGSTLKVAISTAPSVWVTVAPASGGVPSGLVTLVTSGTCAAGYTELSGLSGKTLVGTVAANGDVGATGGADTITPTGTNGALTFTGSSANTSAVSAGTPAGTNGTSTVTPLGTIAWPAGVPTFTGSALGTHAHELPWQIPTTTTIRQIAVGTFGTGTSRAATAVSAAGTANTTSAAVALSQAVSAGTPAGTVAWPAGVPTLSGSSSTVGAQTFTGSALGTHQHTLTATGTINTPAFTGTNFDNRSAYLKVIFCRKD